MSGQGNPLPPDFPYKGQWLIEDLLFIYEPTDAQALGGEAPRFTASASNALGFDASQIADVMGISIQEVFSANTDGSLTVKYGKALTPRGTPGRRYLFNIGERQCALIMDRNDNAGTA